MSIVKDKKILETNSDAFGILPWEWSAFPGIQLKAGRRKAGRRKSQPRDHIDNVVFEWHGDTTVEGFEKKILRNFFLKHRKQAFRVQIS